MPAVKSFLSKLGDMGILERRVKKASQGFTSRF